MVWLLAATISTTVDSQKQMIGHGLRERGTLDFFFDADRRLAPPNSPELTACNEPCYTGCSGASRFPNLSRLCLDAGHRIAGIDDELGPIGQLLIIHRLVR